MDFYKLILAFAEKYNSSPFSSNSNIVFHINYCISDTFHWSFFLTFWVFHFYQFFRLAISFFFYFSLLSSILYKHINILCICIIFIIHYFFYSSYISSKTFFSTLSCLIIKKILFHVAYSDLAIFFHQLLPTSPQLRVLSLIFFKSSNNKAKINKKHTQNEKTQKWKTEYKKQNINKTNNIPKMEWDTKSLQ